MRRQTLLQALILSSIILVVFGMIFMIRLRIRRAMDPSRQQQVSLGLSSLKIPEGYGPGHAYQDHAWEVREFRGGSLGNLRLATEQADGIPWEHLCARWFEMPVYPAGPSRFKVGNYDWFFQEVPLFGRGAYVLRKRGQLVRYVAVFEHEGVRHWIGLDTRNALIPQKELFDGMLGSLRLADGTSSGPELDAALRSITQQTRYRFIQPLEIILLIPALVVVLIAIIQFLVRRRAGRLPEIGLSAFTPPLFQEGGIEISLARPFQRRFMDCAVLVTSDDLVVYTFGTPFLTMPRRSWKNRLEVGHAWLGLPFVKLELEDPPLVRKWSKFYRAMKSPVTLRIYTRDAERLRVLLQGD